LSQVEELIAEIAWSGRLHDEAGGLRCLPFLLFEQGIVPVVDL
jgi:hypothetical protein